MKQQRTFDTYNDVDSFHYSCIHDEIKMLEYGYGKVTDHVSRKIRLKRMTREEGIRLVGKYQKIESRDLKLFLNWIGISQLDFYTIINKHKSQSIWKSFSSNYDELEDPISNHLVEDGIESARLKQNDNSCNFILTDTRDPNPIEDKYILIGRGWVD